MKKICLATVALSALLGAPALAADMAPRPYTKAPPMLAPAYNWSGFYAGLNAGYTFGDNNNITTEGQTASGAPFVNVLNVAGGARPALVRANRDGFIGGGQIGYNWQWTPNWVFGIEADIQYVDINRTTLVVTTSLPAAGSLPLNNTFRTETEYLGTVRGRLGYTWGATMLYGTGGFAYARVNNSASFSGPVGAGALQQFFGQDRSTRTGYVVGGGIEHMFAQNWSIKGEYLYYDLQNSNVNVALVGNGGGGTGYNTTFRNDGHIVRAGLNYKFGGPVVARY